jgi:hypothetical protein
VRRLVLAMRWDVSGRTTATHPVILLPGQTGLTSQVAAPSYADSTGRTDMPLIVCGGGGATVTLRRGRLDAVPLRPMSVCW